VAYREFLNLLGMGVRAGKFALGTCACEKLISRKKMQLLILDRGLATRTIENFKLLCGDGKFEIVRIEENDFESKTGMNYRIIGVSDKQFATALIDKFKGDPHGGIVNEQVKSIGN